MDQIANHVTTSVQVFFEMLDKYYAASEVTVNNITIIDGQIKDCKTDRDETELWDIFLIALGVLLLIILSYVYKRVSFKPNCCRSRPGLTIPMFMIDSHAHSVKYILAFLSVAEEIYNFLFNFEEKYGVVEPIAKFFIRLFVALLLSIEYFSIFAAIANRNLFGRFVGIFMVALVISAKLVRLYQLNKCYTGTAVVPITIYAIAYVSVDVVLMILFLISVIKRIIRLACKSPDKDQYTTTQNNYRTYVKAMLKKKKPVVDEEKQNNEVEVKSNLNCGALKSKVKSKIYAEIPGFKIPPRLLIGITVGLYLCFRVIIDQIKDLTPTTWRLFVILLDVMRGTGMDIKKSIHILFVNNTGSSAKEIFDAHRHFIYFYVNLIIGCIVAGFVLSLINSIVSALLIVRNYRLDFHRIVQSGFDTLLPSQYISSSSSMVLGFVTYSGYQAAYVVWGYFLFSILLIFVLFIVIGVILVPLFFIPNNIWLEKLISIAPVLVASFIFSISQSLVVRFLFVHERGKLMAINNRRAFMIYCHLSFLLNSLIGLFSCLRRLLVWTASGFVFLGRLDFCVMPDFMTNCDKGFMAYAGFIYTELYHHNPILRCCVDIMLSGVRDGDQSPDIKEEGSQNSGIGLCKLQVSDDRKRSKEAELISKRCRIKWNVAYTLIKNPSLISVRKVFLLSLETRCTEDDSCNKDDPETLSVHL